MKTRSQSTKCVAPRKKTVQVTTPDNAPRVHKGLIRTPARRNLKALFEQYRGKVPATQLFKKAGVSKLAGYAILASDEDRSTLRLSTRGRKCVVSQEEVETIVMVEDSSFLMGSAPHKQVANYLGLAVEASESALVDNIKKKT